MPQKNKTRPKSPGAVQYSIIIPVKEIGYYLLFENLPAMTQLVDCTYEVIVLPNQHAPHDTTLLQQYPWLRIIPTGTITRPAMKRDIGVTHAKGEYIAFIDDDAYPDPLWLANATAHFGKKSIAAVCGPGILPPQAHPWEQVFDDILTTKIGSGSYSYRFIPGKQQAVTDYPSMNFIIRKSVFEKVGGFDNDYWPGEDSKLCNDVIRRNPKAILYDPSVLVYHHRRKQLRPFLRQHGQYGYHRGAFYAQGDKNSQDMTYLIPSCFVAYLIMTPVVLLLSYFYNYPFYVPMIVVLPLVLYLLLLLYIMVGSFLKRKSIIISFGAALTLVAMHIMYGVMFIKGYIRVKNNQHIYG